MYYRQIFGLLVLLVCFPIRATAQEADDVAPIEDFFDVVDVEIANIDVWVTDKDGSPVAGLTRDDFLVFSDGEPTTVSNFYAVYDGRPAVDGTTEAAAATDDLLDPVARVPRLEPEIAPEHRLWLIVYIDNYNIDPIERNRIFPALRIFLGNTLRSGDQAMLVTYDRALEVRQPFTTDSLLIQDALDDIFDDTGHAVVRKRDQFDTLQRIDQADSANQGMIYARQYAEEQMNGIQYTVDALRRMIDSLGGLPGRKAVVHVSSGVPMAAGEEMFYAVAEKFGGSEAYAEIPRHDTSRSFERINRHANAHRVAFYTVDAGGLKAFEFGNAEYGGFVDSRLRMTLDSVVPENLQAPLRLMALETGGRAILNQNEILPALQQAAEDFRSFYSLGIASVAADTGRYHRVEVKLREHRKDLQLRYRAGYRSKTTESRIQENLRSALLYSHQANPLDVQVTWGRAERQEKGGTYLLPLRIQVPLADVVLLPRAGGKHEASLRLYFGAVGEDGGTSEIDVAPLGIRLADEHVEAAKRESLVHSHQLLLTPGRKKIGVAVFDLFGRETSVVTYYVQIGPAAELGDG